METVTLMTFEEAGKLADLIRDSFPEVPKLHGGNDGVANVSITVEHYALDNQALQNLLEFTELNNLMLSLTSNNTGGLTALFCPAPDVASNE